MFVCLLAFSFGMDCFSYEVPSLAAVPEESFILVKHGDAVRVEREDD